MKEKELKSLIKEMIIQEYVNPKLATRLSYVIEQLNDIYETAINTGITHRETDMINIKNSIEILKTTYRHMAQLGKG